MIPAGKRQSLFSMDLVALLGDGCIFSVASSDGNPSWKVENWTKGKALVRIQGAPASFCACHSVWQHVQELGGGDSHIFSHPHSCGKKRGLREVLCVSASLLCLHPSQTYHIFTQQTEVVGEEEWGWRKLWQAPERKIHNFHSSFHFKIWT